MADVLSQSQIDDLLKSLSGVSDDAGTEGDAAAEAGTQEPKLDMQSEASSYYDGDKGKKEKKYDFYSPKKFTKDRLKLLKGIFDNYSRIASSQINSIYRVSSEVEVLTVEEQRYYEFSNALGDTDVITLINASLPDFSKNPQVILHISPTLCISMIDRMLGGTGTTMPDDIMSYNYTDIELALYERVVKYLIPIMKETWSSHIRVDYEFDRIEENPSMFSGVAVDETIAIIVLNVSLGDDISGQMTFCFPGTLLTSIFNIMDKNRVVNNLDVQDNREETREDIMDSIKESTLDISVILGKAEVNLSDIYDLKVGDVVCLNKPKDSNVEVCIDGHAWYTGKLGVLNRNIAVELDEYIVNEKGLSAIQGMIEE